MTLLLTRPQQDSENLATQLPNVECFIEPMFEIFNHDAMIYQPDKIKIVICTSKHAVRALNNAYLNPNTWYFAIGEITANELRTLGINKIINTDDNLNKLIQLILQLNLSPQEEILYLRGEQITFDLADHFKRHNLTTREMIVYHAVQRTNLSQSLIVALATNQIKTAAFFSENTAKIFANLIKLNNLIPIIQQINIFTISDKVAQTFYNLACRSVNTFVKTNKLLELINNYYTHEKENK